MQHAGGKVTISPGPNHSYRLRYDFGATNSRDGLYQVAVSYSGVPLAAIPAVGLGGKTAPYPQPSVVAFVASDIQGMWGRICPNCRSPFRTDHVVEGTVCPYCTFAHESVYFITDQQLKYLRGFAETVNRAMSENKELTINFDDVTDSPNWTYNERQLQRRYTCTTCHVQTDILGEYGSCPKCGKRNSGSIFHRKVNEIESQIRAAAAAEQYPPLLIGLVSVFEDMANDLKRILVSIPCHPARRKQISQLNFQDIAVAVGHLSHWQGFDISHGWAVGELGFVGLMFKRRNLFTHSGGRVDEKYLGETGDPSFELNEVIVLKYEEMERLVPLIRKLGSSLIAGVEAIEVRWHPL